MVEQLPGMCEALGSMFSTEKKSNLNLTSCLTSSLSLSMPIV